MNCPYCNTLLANGAASCPECGKSMMLSDVPTGIFPGSNTDDERTSLSMPGDDEGTETYQPAMVSDALHRRPTSEVNNEEPSLSLGLNDRFDLRDKISSDALGESYRAYDRELGDEVRLKLFYPHFQSDHLLKRLFRIELKALRRLTHPGILAGYELYDREELFFTTELPVGESLKNVLKRGALPVNRISVILRQLLDIVSFIHENGILHRDIKPEHLYLDGEDRLKLGGFSLVKMVDFATVTMKSQMMMSPRYQAPEILRGKAATISSDLYAVGLVLVEMLTGNPFSTEESLIEQCEIKSRIVQDWWKHLSLPYSREMEFYVDRLVPRLLHPDPLERYASAREILADCSTGVKSEVTPDRDSAIRDDEIVRDDESCLVCGAKIVPKVQICLNCGTSFRRLREWSHGPYLVLANISFQKTKEGKWRNWIKPNSVQRLKVMKLLELFYKKTPPSGHNSFTRYVVVARRVDKETADHLIQLFDSHGIRARKLAIGKLGDILFGWYLRIPGKVMAISLAGLTLLAPFVILGIAFQSTVAELLFGPQIMLMNLLVFAAARLMYFSPNTAPLFRFVAQKDLPLPPPPHLIESYGKLTDERLKVLTRQLISETRSLVQWIEAESQRATNPSNFRPDYFLDYIDRVEKSAVALLETVPETSPTREAELLETAQRLDTRLKMVSPEEKNDLEKTLNEIFSTLERLKETQQYRIKIEEQIASISERVRNSFRDILRRKEIHLDARVQDIFDELQASEDEHEALREQME